MNAYYSYLWYCTEGVCSGVAIRNVTFSYVSQCLLSRYPLSMPSQPGFSIHLIGSVKLQLFQQRALREACLPNIIYHCQSHPININHSVCTISRLLVDEQARFPEYDPV